MKRNKKKKNQKKYYPPPIIFQTININTILYITSSIITVIKNAKIECPSII